MMPTLHPTNRRLSSWRMAARAGE